MSPRNTILIFVFISFLTACSPETIQSGSEEEFQSSIETVRNSLPEEDRVRYDEAIQAIAFDGVTEENLFSIASNPDSITTRMQNSLEGMTGEEVIQEGQRILAQRRAQQREQALSEIDEVRAEIEDIERRQQEAALAGENIESFEVSRSRFYWSESTFIEEPVIELTVVNNTEYSVSRAYFHGTLATPGRAVPWVSEDFNYQIRGGIEPGEELTWELSPNTFSDWGQAPKDRDDMVLTVEVYRIDGPDGEPIYDTRETEDLEEEKSRLEERLSELQDIISG